MTGRPGGEYHGDMLRPPRRLVVVAQAALILAAACQRDSGAESEGSEPGAEAFGSDRDAPAAQGPAVELLTAGDAPRRELRYELSPGASERVTIDLDMEMAVALGDVPSPPVQLPRMQMVLDLRVDEAVGDDGARYSFELSEARTLDSDGVDPTVLRAIERGLADTIGTRGTAVVDARGFNRQSRVDIPEGAPPETRQMMETTAQQMEQLAAPLPAEPVGEGARWEVVQHLEQNGVALVQTSVMTLESLDDDSGTISTSIRQTADPQTVEMPGAMAGASAELVELRSRGDGEFRFDLSRLMPLRATMRSESETRFEIDVGEGESQPMTTQMELALTVEAE